MNNQQASVLLCQAIQCFQYYGERENNLYGVEEILSLPNRREFINIKRRFGLRPLHIAVACSIECARLLLQAGRSLFDGDDLQAFIDSSDDFGNTPYFLAVYRLEILKRDLLSMMLHDPKGSVVSQVNSRYIEQLRDLCVADVTQLIKLLANSGANIEAKNCDGETAGFWANHQSTIVSQHNQLVRTSKKRGVVQYWPFCYGSAFSPVKTVQTDSVVDEEAMSLKLTQ